MLRIEKITEKIWSFLGILKENFSKFLGYLGEDLRKI